MKKPVQENRRSAIALRLFEALCERYPDKYVTLIQPRAKKKCSADKGPQTDLEQAPRDKWTRLASLVASDHTWSLATAH